MYFFCIRQLSSVSLESLFLQGIQHSLLLMFLPFSRWRTGLAECLCLYIWANLFIHFQEFQGACQSLHPWLLFLSGKRYSYSSVLWLLLPSFPHKMDTRDISKSYREKASKISPLKCSRLQQVSGSLQTCFRKRCLLSKLSASPCNLQQTLREMWVYPVLRKELIVHGSTCTQPCFLPFLPYEE